MQHLLIEHVAGDKVGQRETFVVQDTPSLLIGRDLAAQVRYSDAVDSVSRQHARIEIDATHQTLMLRDLGGRNGLFVNGRPVAEAVAVQHGDRVRLGHGGPEFVVKLDPVPTPSPKQTRLVTLPAATREVTLDAAGAVAAKVADAAAAAPQPVGRETVERMVTQGRSRSLVQLLIAASVAVLVLGAATWAYLSRRDAVHQDELQKVQANVGKALEVAQAKPADWKQLAVERYGGAVVYIEASWRLLHKQSRQPVYHRYKEITVEKETAMLPMYVAVDGALEPVLTTRSGSGPLIAGTHSGTGFVVHKDGFVMTNRHVATAWMTTMPGILKCPCVLTDGKDKEQVVPRATESMQAMIRRWVPAQSRQGGGSATSPAFFGENQLLDVTFPSTKNRIGARVVNVSSEHDVAMMRVDVPFELTPLPLADAGARPKLAQEVLVMGYPGVSPIAMVKVPPQDPFNRESRYALVPAVSVASGTISHLSAPSEDGKQVSSLGDVYQLTVNATGPGNSGGPVFDDSGRVSSVFFAGNERVTYAVPIKYALELMSRGPSTGGSGS